MLEVHAKEILESRYGREVPQKVRLLPDFDLPESCGVKAGDVLSVALPPENVELDLCTLFVWLPSVDAADPTKERVYDHEVESVSLD